MNLESDFDQAICQHLQALDSVVAIKNHCVAVSKKLIEVVDAGGTIYWCGNGGSAADCQHYAAELMVRYRLDRPPVRSVALTTDSSLLTAHCNDIGFETIFERQVSALVSGRDALVGISTSGNSKNVALALEAGKNIGCYTLGILGNDGGNMVGIPDDALVVNSKVTASIQEAHLVVGHFLCSSIETFLIQDS
ncbi:SIS domain-containing protein [Alloalcanivorax profundimaris]|uniref:SIS domain-containing protein n=1 Tax=Alloalcanivorax profundimaris TaxID=2735259 RepID=UPI001887909E|nr:SIS domain-containing protein [Alloalcanivorax profundimaris]MBF1801806.1 SIS domain-containing protein [Alloalcanivorax profundimaris]